MPPRSKPHSGRKRALLLLALHVCLPMLVGGAIYVLWRTPTLRMFAWFEALGLDPQVQALRLMALPLQSSLPSWTLYSLPDGCWVYALTAFMMRFWAGGPRLTRALWVAAGPVLGLGSELGQLLGWVPGTYEHPDVIACAVATVLAIGINRRRKP